MTPGAPLRFLLLVISILNLALVVWGDCYWPDGTQSDEHVECQGGEHSKMCCMRRDLCLSNLLCKQADDKGGLFYRGACSDKSWGGGGCLVYCMKAGDGRLSHQDVRMTRCDEVSDSWWCQDTQFPEGNCSSGEYITALPGESRG